MADKRNVKHIRKPGVASRRFVVFGSVSVSPEFDWSVESVTKMVNGCILGSVGVVTVELKAREL
jgi:hypothetical protein